MWWWWWWWRERECDDIDFEAQVEARDRIRPGFYQQLLFLVAPCPVYTSFELSSIMAKELSEENCYVALTHDYLDAKAIMDRVRSPKAGAIVLFAGGVSHTHIRIGIYID